MMRRWKEEIGRRSSRAPAFTGTARSLLPREHSQAAHRQRFGGQAAVLVKRILLRRQEKFLTVPRGIRIEPQNALDEGIDVGGKRGDRTDVRNKADLLRLLWGNWVAEEDEGKRETWQRVFAEIGHDRSWCETKMHLGKSQRDGFAHVDEIAHDREAEAKAKRIALYFCH